VFTSNRYGLVCVLWVVVLFVDGCGIPGESDGALDLTEATSGGVSVDDSDVIDVDGSGIATARGGVISAVTTYQVTVKPALGLIDPITVLNIWDRDGRKATTYKPYWTGTEWKTFNFSVLAPGKYRFVGVTTGTYVNWWSWIQGGMRVNRFGYVDLQAGSGQTVTGTVTVTSSRDPGSRPQ